MSTADGSVELLSREEIDAILASVARDGLPESAGALGAPFRADARGRGRDGGRFAPLRSMLEAFASDWARHLSSNHQRRVGCRPIDLEEVDAASFSEALLATDRLALFEVGPTAAPGFVLLSRPLVFALLALEFGARRISAQQLPVRAYSGIEQRFLERISARVLAMLEASWRETADLEARAAGLIDPSELAERLPSKLVVAHLDVTGLDVVGRVRVGLPARALLGAEPVRSATPAGGSPELVLACRSLPVRVSVELGCAELPLARLRALRVGELLPVEPSLGEGLLLRVEGEPKFRAQQGSVGRRLAVQVIERI